VTIDLLVVCLLILINGFFAMSELAVLSSRSTRLRQKEQEGSKRARTVLKLIEDPNHFLSTVQTGISVVAIISGAYSGATLGPHFGNIMADHFPDYAEWAHKLGFTLVVAMTSYVSLVIGELVPKRLALTNPEAIALAVAPAMSFISLLGSPLVLFLGASTDLALRITGLSGDRDTGVTEEDVSAIIAEGARTGVLEEVEKNMIDRVLRLADRPVKAIITPRTDIVWFDINEDLQSVRTKIREHGRSRYVVADGQVDEFLGIAVTKDILEETLRGEEFSLRHCLIDPLVIPEHTRVLRVLETFRETGRHIAVVVDEYGSLEGIVTITDILESIAGDLPHAGATAENMPVEREDGSWVIDGMENIDDVERITGLKGIGNEGDYHTLGGFVLTMLKQVPEVGENFVWHNVRFEVMAMEGRRIDRVQLHRLPRGEEESDG